MKKTILIAILLSLTFFNLYAQDIQSKLYKGQMNDDISITLYIRAQEHDCSMNMVYSGMYKYDNSDKWIQVEITKNNKNQFIFVENRFTGVLILKKNDNGFDGVWISPDAKKQLKVELNELEITKEDTNHYEEKFDIVYYENNDC